jgi:hypothetical protein
MYEIEMNEMSEAFFPCWKAAGVRLSKQVDGGIQSWLRAQPYPPFLEHLSFRLGNQLFFVRVEDVNGKVQGPGNPRGFITAAQMANGRACILPMRKKLLGGAWVADMPGWGLLDAASRRPVTPVTLITDQKIEMSSWEVHDMAVQVVRDNLERQGFELMSWQANPEVDPSIWCIGKTKRPEWVVMRPTIFPANRALRIRGTGQRGPALWVGKRSAGAAMARSCNACAVHRSGVAGPMNRQDSQSSPVNIEAQSRR